MALKLQTSGDSGREIALGFIEPIKEALDGAMNEAAALIRDRGRRNIAAAGFSPRWQEGFGVVKRGEGEKSELSIFHRIGYAAVFESQTVIRGRPLLWIPIEDNLPPPPPRRSWSPRLYARTVGPLASVRGGRRPLLVGRPRGRTRAVPLFFGVESITIPDKWDLNEVIDGVMDEFERLYDKHLKVD